MVLSLVEGNSKPWFHLPFVNCICDLSTVLSVQNCLVRCDNGTFTVVVGDFGLAEKIPDYRSVK